MESVLHKLSELHLKCQLCKQDATHICGGCFQELYCGQACQIQHWDSHQCIGLSEDGQKRDHENDEDETEEKRQKRLDEEANRRYTVLVQILSQSESGLDALATILLPQDFPRLVFISRSFNRAFGPENVNFWEMVARRFDLNIANIAPENYRRFVIHMLSAGDKIITLRYELASRDHSAHVTWPPQYFTEGFGNYNPIPEQTDGRWRKEYHHEHYYILHARIFDILESNMTTLGEFVESRGLDSMQLNIDGVLMEVDYDMARAFIYINDEGFEADNDIYPSEGDIDTQHITQLRNNTRVRIVPEILELSLYMEIELPDDVDLQYDYVAGQRLQTSDMIDHIDYGSLVDRMIARWPTEWRLNGTAQFNQDDYEIFIEENNGLPLIMDGLTLDRDALDQYLQDFIASDQISDGDTHSFVFTIRRKQ